jgi:hypothetical protein
VNHDLPVWLGPFALGTHSAIVPQRDVYDLALETRHRSHRYGAPASGHSISGSLRHLLDLDAPTVPVS